MLSVNQVLVELYRAPADVGVRFDFCGTRPTGVISWRGIYAEPALTWDAEGRTTVAELIAMLEDAIAPGAVFEGYKGGKYTYTGRDSLHVDNYGRYTETEIHKITFNKWEAVIHTRREGA